MGQDWKAINIDKRQSMGCWGKLEECLFDASPDFLVYPLKNLKIAEHEKSRVTLNSINPRSAALWVRGCEIGLFA